MRALTLIRPMDWAIIHGGKDVENRTWAPMPSVLHKFIAVHSGMKWAQFHADQVRYPGKDSWPGGRIIGVVRIDSGGEVTRSPWAHGGFVHWRLSGAFPLSKPVMASGGRRLWRVPDDVAAQVEEQLPPGMVMA